MQPIRFSMLLAAAATLLPLASCGEPDDGDEIECDEEGNCDTVPKSPCDGVMVDMSGANNKRVAGRLKDPVAQAVFRKGTTCPKTFSAIMDKLRENDKEGCEGERDGIQTRVVSETAQASGQATDYRTVVTRQCGSRDTEAVMFSLFGVTEEATSLPRGVEIIAFDEAAGVFNYYETNGSTLNFFGNSKDMLKGADGEKRRCAGCHTGGGVVMKELDTPWMHWEGHMDTPGAATLVDKHKNLGSKTSGAELEGVVKSGNTKWNATRIKHVKSKGKLADLLKPLFCTVEVNIDNGADFESPVKGGTGGDQISDIPFDSLLDPQLKSFGGIPIQFADYDALIKANGQTVEGVSGAIDTVFDYAFIERSHADNDYVEQLVAAGLIDDDFVKDVLMVDFTRPVFSDDRCGLLSLAPDMAAKEATAAKVRDEWIKSLEADAPAAGSPAAQLLANLKAKADGAAHTAKVDAFIAACTALGSRPFLQNAMAVTALNRNTARELPIMEFGATMPKDRQNVPAGTRLHPATCQLTTSFVAP